MNKIINDYTDNEVLRNSIIDFVEMRKKKKKPLTKRGLIAILMKLEKMFENDELKIEALNESVCNSWNNVFDKRVKNYDVYNEINKKEMINHPQHYNMGKFEAIDVIEDWKLNFNLGNTVKYISRAGHKDDIIQDLKKSLWYLQREINRLEKGE